MSMEIPSIKVPGFTEKVSGFGYITRVDLSTAWAGGVSSVHVGVFASAASDAAGEPPLKIVTFTPGQVLRLAVDTPAAYGDPELISPAVFGDPPVINEGPPIAYGVPPLIRDAVYGPAPLLAPATSIPAVVFPSLTELMQHPDFAAAFNVVRTYLYNVVSQYSEFSGSSQA